ncbi:MAG: DUF1549 domain-containing protein [Fuerstiella sp.]|nr:DUF1549 domain-containing protein [Fuerstiella sp.]
MTHRCFRSLLLCEAALSAVVVLQFSCSCTAEDPVVSDTETTQGFRKNVLPILKENCFECHSHDTKQARGGLVLDSRSGWVKGGESGPAIVPGRPDESLLIQAVRYEHLEMPPTGKLPDRLIHQLERWVADGAPDPRTATLVMSDKGIDIEAGRRHWAFRPVRETALPEVLSEFWPYSDVDRYLLAKLEESRLSPVQDADRYTWLRRVSFDLTGLPPTIEQIREFEVDSSLPAREAIVDRLLDSRAFGERWARHWLDLVGYADQIGTSNNIFAEHAWRYRDYVIDAFNNDKPFDQFIREQIAGDLDCHENIEEQVASQVATGFLVLGDMDVVEADKEKMLVDIIDEQLNKVGKAFLGLTLECARCHDHKFDPVSQRDYYAMAGFFYGTSSVYKTDRGVWSDLNVSELPETDAQRSRREQRAGKHQEQLAQWQQEREQIQDRRAELDELVKKTQLAETERQKLEEQRDVAGKKIGILNKKIMHGEFFAPVVPRTYAVRDGEDPKDMRITIRGNPRALGDLVPRGFLSVVSDKPPAITQGQSGRRQLAVWVSSSKNPLTARVAVNRIWQKLFGEGLVRSVDYFGLPGDRPSHPELLDHLALGFIRNGWSQKKLIRHLVLSRAYGMDSAHDSVCYSVDPDNRLLWRMNRFRLDAEALRDAMIAATGRLIPSGGGPAMPLEYPDNVGGLSPTDVNPPHFRLAKWRPDQEFRRTIYLPVIRSAAQPGPATLRNVFDFAQPSEFTGRRTVTAVPTQALFLMNSPVVKKHAAALAERINEQDDEFGRLQLLWLTLLNRPITEPEQRESQGFLEAAGEAALVELCHALLASNEFLMRL